MFPLTNSKTQKAVLELFFNDPEKEYYLRQIEHLTGYSVGNIRREMVKLGKTGLFITRMLGRIKLYRLNKLHPIYNEIKNIVYKTIGIIGSLRDIFSKHKEVKFAFIYGSFAKGQEQSLSDIDIMIIGDIKSRIITPDIYDYQAKILREINTTFYTPEEFLDKIDKHSHFLTTVVKEPKIFLKGEDNEFGEFIQI